MRRSSSIVRLRAFAVRYRSTACANVTPVPFAFGCSILSVRSESAFSASSLDQSERKTRICFPSSPTVTKPQALRFVRWPGTVHVRCRTFAIGYSLRRSMFTAGLAQCEDCRRLCKKARPFARPGKSEVPAQPAIGLRFLAQDDDALRPADVDHLAVVTADADSFAG